jgi:hypothetical protein
MELTQLRGLEFKPDVKASNLAILAFTPLTCDLLR